MMEVPLIKLNNGHKIPQLGFGVYKVPPEDVYEVVSAALELGYRHIDTASFYGNEAGVGKAIRDSGIPRNEIFVTTKVWNDEHGFQAAQRAFERSLERLAIDYIDLYLIHWPVPGKFLDTWKALEEVYQSGGVRAIGVSNFLEHHVKELMIHAKVIPAVNQIELHPKLQERETIEYCLDHGIAIESWSPLARGKYLDDSQLLKLAHKYEKSPAQIMIKWQLQHNFIVIPKSTSKKRQLENLHVFDFHIEQDDIILLDKMNEGLRVGSHPDHINR